MTGTDSSSSEVTVLGPYRVARTAATGLAVVAALILYQAFEIATADGGGVRPATAVGLIGAWSAYGAINSARSRVKLDGDVIRWTARWGTKYVHRSEILGFELKRTSFGRGRYMTVRMHLVGPTVVRLPLTHRYTPGDVALIEQVWYRLEVWRTRPPA